MPKLTEAKFELIGISKKTYSFNIYPIVEECKDEGGIYVFTKRTANQEGKYSHTVIYIGKAISFEKRFYNHHKGNDIEKNGANCICLMAVPNETERTNIELDLLRNNKTPCNEVNN